MYACRIRHKINGIDAAAKTLRCNNTKPFEAFFCPHSSSDNGHTSSKQPAPPQHIADDQEYWLCSADADLYGKLAEREKLWLKSETATSGNDLTFYLATPVAM